MNPMQMLIQMMQMGNNPNAMINMLMKQNPQVSGLIRQMQQSGLPPQQFVQQYAKQTGQDIRPLLNTLSNFGIKL